MEHGSERATPVLKAHLVPLEPGLSFLSFSRFGKAICSALGATVREAGELDLQALLWGDGVPVPTQARSVLDSLCMRPGLRLAPDHWVG